MYMVYNNTFCHSLAIPISQLYLRRKKYIKGEEEEKKWSTIDLRCMTEESDSGGEIVRQHHLPWRSQGI